MDINCLAKCGAKLPAGQFRYLSRIWLSKLPLLCEVAETEPDQVTVLLDSGLWNRVEEGIPIAKLRWEFALQELNGQDFETEAVHMPHYEQEKSEGNHTWYGSKECSHVNPQVNAMFIG